MSIHDDDANAVASTIIKQRVRNRIIEYLQLATSFDAQREYQSYQVCHVPNELINQWEDWAGGDISAYPAPVFSLEEQNALQLYHSIWESVCRDTPELLPNLESLIGTEPWERLRIAAQKALDVFACRGRLDEDRAIV